MNLPQKDARQTADDTQHSSLPQATLESLLHPKIEIYAISWITVFQTRHWPSQGERNPCVSLLFH